MACTLRVLLLADTHLGFDDPPHPRVDRRRRGTDFFANFERALAPALRGEVDIVVHGGDLLYRSRVPPALVERAFRPIARVAAGGVPVFIVPGNHERSAIPHPLLAVHRNVFVFDRPRTFAVGCPGGTVALSGFPFARDARAQFPRLLAETRFSETPASLRLLCLHQAVEGARVGTPEFMFTDANDVIRARDLPAGFAAVLSGHIHRGQKLTRGLDGAPLPAPVLYPGSIERTSFAERLETKGFLILHFAAGLGLPEGGQLIDAQWTPLPARPMFRIVLGAVSSEADLLSALRRRLADLPADAVVRVDATAEPRGVPMLTAARIRELAPPEMNVDLVPGRDALAGSIARRPPEAGGRASRALGALPGIGGEAAPAPSRSP
jgi:DNA repair exonuclease SbcCD nuclease subunit